MKLQVRKCKYCGAMLSRLGLHEPKCAKLTDAQRADLAQQRQYRENWRARQNGQTPTVVTNGKRLRLCISVELDKVRELLPFIEIDEVKIA